MSEPFRLLARFEDVSGPHRGAGVLTAGESLEQARAVVVALHGRGGTAEDILGLTGMFAGAGWAFLAPQAVGNAWYPRSFLEPLAANEPALSSALETVGATIALAEAADIAAERTVVLGFSQGACLALEFAARGERRFGGVVGLSGGLIGTGQIEGAHPPEDKRFAYRTGLVGTPVFLGCSDVDAHIPVGRVHRSAAVFRELGAEVTERIYPGMGHTVNADEIAWVDQLLATVGAVGA